MGRPRKFNRDGVLDRAIPVFWTYGFARTSVQDLEAATGVNKSGLYAEFAGKEDLFLAALRRYLVQQDPAPILNAAPLGWANIERFLRDGPGRLPDRLGCFGVNSLREVAALPAGARETLVEARRAMRAMIEANVRAEAAGADAGTVCDLVLTFFSGTCIEANLHPDPERVEEKLREFMRMLRDL